MGNTAPPLPQIIKEPEEEQKVVKLSRSARKKIDHSDPEHKCSDQHVRIPAHCRIKRTKGKRKRA